MAQLVVQAGQPSLQFREHLSHALRVCRVRRQVVGLEWTLSHVVELEFRVMNNAIDFGLKGLLALLTWLLLGRIRPDWDVVRPVLYADSRQDCWGDDSLAAQSIGMDPIGNMLCCLLHIFT